MKRNSLLSFNRFGVSLYKLLSKDQAPAQTVFVNKTYSTGEDNFFEVNEQLRTALKIGMPSNPENYKRDLKRFGTPINLIDVADDTIPTNRNKKLLPLAKPFTKQRFKDKYRDDVKRFGTPQRVVDVANDNLPKKKLKPLPTDFSKAVYEKIMANWHVRPVSSHSLNPYSDKFKEFPKAQITVRNNSSHEKEVRLWGVERTAGANIPSTTEVSGYSLTAQITVPKGIHPQGIVYNPANQYMYVANQLSGTVTVINSVNQVVTVIELQPGFPGFCSPVALTVNNKPSSAKYGFIYVACSVANTICVIDLGHIVVGQVTVGTRPVAIAYNSVNNQVYTANLVSQNTTIINSETFLEVTGSPYAAGHDPIGIGVNPINGEVFITNSRSNDVTVYNSGNALVTTIAGVGQRPVSVTFNPANQTMYVVSTNNNTVYSIDTLTHTVSNSIHVGNKPYNSFFDASNNLLYVQNRQDNTLSAIKPDNTIDGTLTFGRQNIGGAYNTANNSFYVSDTTNNNINVIGYVTATTGVSFDSDYSEMREDFKGNPAIIQHARFIVTGGERLSTFRLETFTPTGTIKSKPISFEQYASPQSALNVAEVSGLAGTVIDGKMNWSFRLPAYHTVSILMWFRQFQVKDIYN